ncbi:MAG: YncE family protein [Gammaproteobacteria bacterium]
MPSILPRRYRWASSLVLAICLIPAVAQAVPDLYIAQKGTSSVAILDTGDNNTEVASIPVQSNPTAVAVAPLGSPIFVANTAGNSVSVLNSKNQLTATIPVGNQPDAIAITPGGVAAYVANAGGGDLTEISVAGAFAVQTIAVGSDPDALAVTSDTSLIFVANRASNSVSVVSTPLAATLTTIPVGKSPDAVAISPRGFTVYVANAGSNTVSVIDRPTRTVKNTITVGQQPTGLALSPDGTTLYVTNSGSGTVSLVDTATDTVTGTLNIGGQPEGLSLSPDGSYLYVVEPNQNVVLVIDTATQTIVSTLGPFSDPTSTGSFVGPGDLIAIGTAVPLNIQNTPSQDNLGCSDALGRARHFELIVPPKDGNVSISPTSGIFTYIPNVNFSGEDAFAFRCVAAAGGPSPISNTATVSLLVTFEGNNAGGSTAMGPLGLAVLALAALLAIPRRRSTRPIRPT